MNPLYHECHITLHPKARVAAAPLAKAFGFKLSEIQGDEVLGDGLWLYCNKSGPDKQALYIDMVSLCTALDHVGTPWVRRKIESAIFDERRSLAAQQSI